MSVLVIDPCADAQKAIVNVVHWVDGRRRLHFAQDGAAGLVKALHQRPEVIFCEAELPDITGGKLCSQLRNHLRHTTFVAYTHQSAKVEDDLKQNIFHDVLGKPPCRWRTHAILLNAKNARLQARASEAADSIRRPKCEMPGEVKICVSVVGDALRFNLNVPAGATVGMILQRLGKSIRYFTLMRDGVELEASAMTIIQDGDDLALACERR